MKIINSFLVIISLSFAINAQEKSLNKFDFTAGIQFKLDHSLTEISGLAMANDRLFAHNDEQAVIFQVDMNTGKTIKKFYVGNPALTGDFEGLAYSNNKFYMITSDGFLYIFSEGRDETHLNYKKINTGLSKNNIEGLCFESNTSLLIACKGKGKKANRGERYIYSYDLDNNKLSSEPRYTFTMNGLDKFDLKDFSPSAIEKNEKSGTIYILSSNDKAILEISPDGKILTAVKLDEQKHQQPEGIAFASDGSLLISDEGGKGTALITKYSMKK